MLARVAFKKVTLEGNGVGEKAGLVDRRGYGRKRVCKLRSLERESVDSYVPGNW
jgi:hypothetical protein